MRFIVDAQLPPALALWLNQQGHSAEHVSDFGSDGTSDSEIWERALALGSAIVTKDEDFAVRSIATDMPPRVVWIRVGNTRKAVLMAWFSSLFPEIIQALERGESLIEID